MLGLNNYFSLMLGNKNHQITQLLHFYKFDLGCRFFDTGKSWKSGETRNPGKSQKKSEKSENPGSPEKPGNPETRKTGKPWKRRKPRKPRKTPETRKPRGGFPPKLSTLSSA